MSRSVSIPEVGQAVRVRNRLATVRAVEPYDSRLPDGRLHIVELEYLDDFRYPESEQLLWEVEATAEPLGKTTLPSVDANRPDSPGALQAFVNAHRWTRLNRLREKDGIEDEPLLGVWNSAIQVHPYQLEPVIRALSMPRVSLLLADGVGLGKTIQSGLVLEELLLRRRIRRILVVCPAMLQRQWKYELRRKFNLDFELIDSDSTFQLRRRMGIDTNPWKAFPRIITSMDYLRMPDVLQQFLQASDAGPEAESNGRALPHAPWDLMIVDECHHFAPQSGSRTSQRTRMLREIRFLFEHRIFASATPHNGKTVSFTGLLELLDPIRFQMAVEMDETDRNNLKEVRIRRLKDDINKSSFRPPFAEQLPPIQLPIKLSPKESALYDALREYRNHGQAALAKASAGERWLGQFIYSLLTKRLLSCPYAFARTWWRHVEEEAPDDSRTLFDMARVSAERAEEQTKSDDERSLLEDDAARYSGAYFRSHGNSISDLQGRVKRALEALGYDRRTAEDPGKLPALAKKSDSKTEALVDWIEKNLFAEGVLRDDERLIVFTEYKETLFFLEQRLLQVPGFDKNTLRLLYGGMSPDDFEAVKGEFEDKTSAARLLLATDAASEGINMQEECRWIIHYDIPWSPSKIVQRNGRVSRHGQTRDVSVHYFCSSEDEDLDFLAYVAKKVSTIKDDLGSVERVFDAAIHRHFEGRKIEQRQIDFAVQDEIKKSPEGVDLGHSSESDIRDLERRARQLLEGTDARLGISPEALVQILRTAIAVEGQGALDDIPDRPGFYRLRPPPRWEGLTRQTLTVGSRTDRMELCFDAAAVEEEISGRRIMRLKKHQVLMRLGHPLMRQAMATLSRQLHEPLGNDAVFRWSIAALHRSGFDALLVFHYTVTAINELREPLHDEVFSTVLRIEGDRLSPVDDDFERLVLGSEFLPVKSAERRDGWVRTIRSHWFQHRGELEALLKRQEGEIRLVLERRAQVTLQRELDAEAESYRYRLKELQDRSREQELSKLAKELLREQAEAQQPQLFEEIQEDAKLRVQDIEEQMNVLRQDVDRTRHLLTKERDHRLNTVLPKRFTLLDGSTGVRVLPLALTYLIPATAEDLR
ncbi:DISARM system SNF2-like helicase DrmD [Planctellipticum variicoloris]|uniref:DISARM system SNF2-like helicase DrmD n=1 Tax=Planctellipticum variicoloris TaxID=3064265 RepID=UPI00301361BE|nr:DISARM system SNF2-like helicase DrmD [Planctomycetaceae bacterium SH412]